jgi:hypothetical protein
MMKLVRPHEVSQLKAVGFQEQGPSEIMPGFIVMRLASPDTAPVVDDEIEHIAAAAAGLEAE